MPDRVRRTGRDRGRWPSPAPTGRLPRGFAAPSYQEALPSCPQSAAITRSRLPFDTRLSRSERQQWVQRTGCWSRVTRVLLTYEQVRAYGLPAAEGKRGDPRWPAFARRHGLDPAHPVQWEVEALEPHELQRLVLAAVDPYVDRQVLAGQIAREEAQRRVLADFLGGWGTARG